MNLQLTFLWLVSPIFEQHNHFFTQAFSDRACYDGAT